MRWARAQQRGDFVKYFDSSDSEEESEESEEEAPAVKPVQPAPPLKKVAARAAAKVQSESEGDAQEQSEEEDTSREWDEYCFVCNDGGNVICCDGCTNVAHLSCLKMKSEPTGDWHC
jgi:hypothetical protein